MELRADEQKRVAGKLNQEVLLMDEVMAAWPLKVGKGMRILDLTAQEAYG